MTPKPKCEVTGCDRPAKLKGLCASHYQQRRRGKPLTDLLGPGGQLGDEPLVTFGVRVSRSCSDALDILGCRATEARIILEQEAPRRAVALGKIVGAEAAAETFAAEQPAKKKRRSGA